MIIINTTFYVHQSIDGEFHRWIDTEYIPLALECGMGNPSLAQLLIEPHEGMTGYAMQFTADDLDKAQAWHDSEAARVRGDICSRYGEKILFFTTYMQHLR